MQALILMSVGGVKLCTDCIRGGESVLAKIYAEGQTVSIDFNIFQWRIENDKTSLKMSKNVISKYMLQIMSSEVVIEICHGLGAYVWGRPNLGIPGSRISEPIELERSICHSVCLQRN